MNKIYRNSKTNEIIIAETFVRYTIIPETQDVNESQKRIETSVENFQEIVSDFTIVKEKS